MQIIGVILWSIGLMCFSTVVGRYMFIAGIIISSIVLINLGGKYSQKKKGTGPLLQVIGITALSISSLSSVVFIFKDILNVF